MLKNMERKHSNTLLIFNLKTVVLVYMLCFFVKCTSGRGVYRIETIEDLLCHNLETGSKIPHPEYCNVYIICSDNSAIQISCLNSIFFNPDTEECDPDYKICKSKIILKDKKPTDVVTTSTEATDQTSDATQSLETSSEQRVVTTTPADNVDTSTKFDLSKIVICPDVDDEKIKFISHATDCSIYYLCYHGKPVPFECAAGLHWSNKLKRCVSQEVAKCTTAEVTNYPECPRQGYQFLPHPVKCQNFLLCQNGVKTVQQCQPFYHWDVNERKCKLSSLATCYQKIKDSEK